jgi:hypothetical protein
MGLAPSAGTGCALAAGGPRGFLSGRKGLSPSPEGMLVRRRVVGFSTVVIPPSPVGAVTGVDPDFHSRASLRASKISTGSILAAATFQVLAAILCPLAAAKFNHRLGKPA